MSFQIQQFYGPNSGWLDIENMTVRINTILEGSQYTAIVSERNLIIMDAENIDLTPKILAFRFRLILKRIAIPGERERDLKTPLCIQNSVFLKVILPLTSFEALNRLNFYFSIQNFVCLL